MIKQNLAFVVLSFNHPQLTAKALRSVFRHKIADGQAYLVHNGSLDQHTQSLKDEFPNITHVHLEINKGFTGGANAGLNEAFKKFDKVLFLTNDIELIDLPENISDELEFSAPLIYKRKLNQVDSMGGRINLRTGRLSHIKENSMWNQNTDSQLVSYIPGTAFLISKIYYQKLSGFDESFHTYWEDVDFSYRAQKLGLPLTFVSSIKILHAVGKTCHKNSFYTFYLYQRNRRRFFQKHQIESFSFYFHFIKDVALILFRSISARRFSGYFKMSWKVLYE